MKIVAPFVLLIIILTSSCSFLHNSKLQKPEIHLSPDEISLGAPNEMLFYDGEYHIYYQYIKDSLNIFGHAKSADLLHWKNLPMALSSDSLESIGSSSVIFDWNNVSGLGSGNSPMITFYSSKIKNDDHLDRNYDLISLAYSTDNGITWKKKKEKPVVLDNACSNIIDLKVIWHEETQRWIMLMLTEYHIRMYSSTDLFNWRFENIFDDDIHFKNTSWTHLSFFPIKLEESNDQKWVLLLTVDAGSPSQGSGTQYFVGDFDGYAFKLSGSNYQWLDNGSDNYAGVALSNYIDFGKPLSYISCISNVRYKKIKDSLKISDSYSIPRELTLVKKYGEYLLLSKPPVTTAKSSYNIGGTVFSEELKLKGTRITPLEIDLLFDVSNRLSQDFAESFGIQLSNSNGDKLSVGYNNRRFSFFISEQKKSIVWNDIYFAPYIFDKQEIDLKIIIDKSSVELFALGGMITLTKKYSISDDWNKISLFAEGGTIKLKEGRLNEIRRIR